MNEDDQPEETYREALEKVGQASIHAEEIREQEERKEAARRAEKAGHWRSAGNLLLLLLVALGSVCMLRSCGPPAPAKGSRSAAVDQPARQQDRHRQAQGPRHAREVPSQHPEAQPEKDRHDVFRHAGIIDAEGGHG
ncbi:MAG: hypothetical protein ABSA30_00215 [Candidatus Aminicenantales bacterium]|jgi:hypothetical protein